MLSRCLPPAIALLAALTIACSSSTESQEASPSATLAATLNNEDTAGQTIAPHDASTSGPDTLPPGYRTEVVIEGLSAPTSVAATPDGRLLIAEQETGRVRVVQDGALQEEPWVELDVYVAPNTPLQELGLVSIAVDPLFEEHGYVYLYYTTEGGDGPRTVLSRMRDVDGRGIELTEILEIDAQPERLHIAGGIAFDGDDAILVGVGDHHQAERASRIDTLPGKVLRIDRDGNALPDNPFVDIEGADARVYAYGLRNPYGIAVDAESGRTYITENRTVAGDAVYELEAGADYGWPEHPAVLREPLLIYEHPQGLAAITVYRGDALPEFDGDLFFCGFHAGGKLHRADPTSAESTSRDRLIAAGCTSGLTVGADGFLYFLSIIEGKLLRISR